MGPKVASEKEASGTLQFALTGTASNGSEYRLRNAEFSVSGYPDYCDSSSASGGEGGGYNGYYEVVVSSETDLTSPVITQRVLPGYYYVHFSSSNWYLEELTEAGPERVEQAVLISPRVRYVNVWDGSSTTVSYRFGVDGEVIDFRSGDINIAIEIERPEDNDFAGAGAGGVGGAAGEPGQGGDWAHGGSF